VVSPREPDPRPPQGPAEETTTWHPQTPFPTELENHPRYRLLEVLGAGGMGTVYKAEHRLMHRLVAIKVVRDTLLDNPAARLRFRRELRTAARLAHQHIVAAHDAEEAGSLCFLVMEYVPGESLDRLVSRRGALPVAEACAYVRQAALGLQHVHEHGLVHRDIKPSNLIRAPGGTIKVLDFGLVRFTAERAAEQTAPGVVLGTPAYMAPEQARDARSADIRADIYSLGGTLRYLLAGKRTEAAISKLRPDVPAGLARVLRRMLATDPADRYQTPAEVAAALTPFARMGKRAAGPAAAVRGPRRLRAGFAAALVGLFAVGVLGSLLLWLAAGRPGWGARLGDGAGQRPAGEDQPPGPDPRAALGGEKQATTPRKGTTGRAGEAKPPASNPASARTTIVLMAARNPVMAGQPVALQVTVTAEAPSVGTPTGHVRYYNGDEHLATSELSGGRCEFPFVPPKPGDYTITAQYTGDEDFSGCQAVPLALHVTR
jgi:tRNA A-37 threonylcarbamoyl transferase component Bud32